MKRVLAGMALLLGVSAAAAPDMLWVTKLDLGHDEYGEGIASRGNAIAVAGYVAGGPTADWLVVRLNQDGYFSWARTYDAGFDELAVSTCLDAESNVLVTGYTYVSKDDRRPSLPRLHGWDKILKSPPSLQTHYVALTAKYDSLGNLKWFRADTDYIAAGIAADSEGNSYISGAYLGTSFGLWLAKLNPSGDTIWSRTYSFDLLNLGYRLAIDRTGNIVAAAIVGDTVNIDCMTLKFTPAGDTIWTRRFDRGPTDQGCGVAVDPFGNVVVVGISDTSAKAATTSALAVKYDSSGVLDWYKVFTFDTDNGLYGAACDSVGEIYVAGTTGADYTYDCLTMKLDTAGGVLWSAIYGGSADDGAGDVACDSIGNPIIAGYVADTIAWNSDVLIAKYSPFTGIAESHVSGPRPMAAVRTISATPDFVLSVPCSGHYDIRLCDLCGRTRQQVFRGHLDKGTHRFSFAGQPAGTYFVRVAAPDGGMSCLRLVLIG